MKIFILMSILWASFANAAPFLICDPQNGVDSYEMQGDIIENNYQAESDGSIKYDLSGITEGTYNIELKACNIWGCSNFVPFAFTKQLPQLSTNIRLSQ